MVRGASQTVASLAVEHGLGCSVACITFQDQRYNLCSRICRLTLNHLTAGEVLYSFSNFFHYCLLQDVEYSSLCSIAGLCCLSILNIVVVYVNPKLLIYFSPPPFPFGKQKFVFCVVSLFLFCKQIHLYDILDSTYK